MSICAGAFVLTKSLCMMKGASCSEVSRPLFDLFVFAILIGSSDAVSLLIGGTVKHSFFSLHRGTQSVDFHSLRTGSLFGERVKKSRGEAPRDFFTLSPNRESVHRLGFSHLTLSA